MKLWGRILTLVATISIVVSLVLVFPIFSSAEYDNPYNVSYTLTSNDLLYLYNHGYLTFHYIIDGNTLTTDVTNPNWGTTSTWGTMFYTPLLHANSSFDLTFSLELPFTFRFISGTLRYTPSLYYPYTGSYLQFYNGSTSLGSFAPNNSYSYDIGYSLYGVSGGTYYYSISFNDYSINSSYYNKITYNTSLSSVNADFASFFDFQNCVIEVSNYVASDIMGQVSNPDWGVSSGSGGGSGSGSVSDDSSAFINYLSTMDSSTSQSVTSLDTASQSAITDLNNAQSSFESVFDDNNDLKTDMGITDSNIDNVIDTLDVTSTSIINNGVTYTSDFSSNLSTFSTPFKSLIQSPLIYFMFFFLFIMAAVSFVLYGRA